MNNRRRERGGRGKGEGEEGTSTYQGVGRRRGRRWGRGFWYCVSMK